MENTLQHLKLSDISESKTNPRKHFDEPKLKELASSIEQHGVLQPIVVRVSDNGSKFELVAGARRFRASKIAKKETIPAIALSLTDEQALEMQVIENLQRDDLHPLEEAEGYAALLKGTTHSPTTIAAKLGKSPSYIRKRLQLTKLGDAVKKAWYDEKITLGHAQQLSVIEDENLQKTILKAIADRNMSPSRLSEYLKDDVLIDLSKASFKLADATIKPDMGACTTCEFNTATDKDLFGDKQGQGQCRQPKCFQEKVQINFEREAVKEVEKGNRVASPAETKKIFTGYKNTYPSDQYVNVTDTCWDHPKNLSYKKIIGDRLKETIALDGENKPRRLYLKKEVLELLRSEKWYKPRGSNKKPVDRSVVIRSNRRDKIENDIFEKALGEVLAKKKSVDLLCEVAIHCAGYSVIEVARTLLEKGKTVASYENSKAVKMVMEKISSFKTSDERLVWVLQEFSKKNSDLRDIFETRFSLDSKKFAKEAKEIEEKQWLEKHPKPAKAKTAKKNESKSSPAGKKAKSK